MQHKKAGDTLPCGMISCFIRLLFRCDLCSLCNLCLLLTKQKRTTSRGTTTAPKVHAIFLQNGVQRRTREVVEIISLGKRD